MENSKKFAIFLVLLVALPSVVSAAELGDFTSGQNTYNIFKLIFSSNIPEDILTAEKVLQFLVFPFFSVVMIMYGILSEIKIFRKGWINGVLAFFIALISSASGYLWVAVQAFFYAGGYLGTIIFGSLLIIGIVLWATSRLWGWGLLRGGNWRSIARRSHQALMYETQLSRLRDLYGDLRGVGDPESLKQADEVLKRMESVEKELHELRKKAAKEATESVRSSTERPAAGVG